MFCIFSTTACAQFRLILPERVQRLTYSFLNDLDRRFTNKLHICIELVVKRSKDKVMMCRVSGYPDTWPKLSLPGSIFRFQLPVNDFQKCLLTFKPHKLLLTFFVWGMQWTISPVSHRKMWLNLDNLWRNFKQYILRYKLRQIFSL